jgi:hypothetical protein
MCDTSRPVSTSRRTRRRIRAIGFAVVAALLAGAPAAEAKRPSIQAFRAFAKDGAIHYRIVLCAPIGADVTFHTRLQHGSRGETYVLAPQRGHQDNICPTWHYTVDDRFSAGRYTTHVTVDVDGRHLRTRRATIHLR